MPILNTFHLLSAWLTIIMLSEIYLVSSECTSSNQCTELNKICNNKRNTCECMEGYNTNSNGTCIKESTKEDTKSFYKALVAVFSILIALVIISITAFLCMRRWKANTRKKLRGREERLQMTNLTHKPSIRQILGEYNEPKYSRQDAGPATEEDFERLVQSLKEDAPVFLNMINEVKRKLNLLDDKNTAPGMQYKALIRDISRVLHILNRKPAKLEMPSDGVSLLLWAENALKRFEYVEQQISTRNPIKQGNSVNSNWGESSTAIGTQDAVL